MGLYVGYTHDAMALLGEGKVLYVCAEYDDYFDYEENAVYFDWVQMDVPYTIESNVHENCTPPSGTTFAGWLVTGWDAPINGLYGGEIHQPGDVINLTDMDQFFLAQYEPVGATYTVTYSCNGGTGTAPSNQTAIENQSFTPAANTCTAPSGYSGFTGWAVSGTNDVKQAGTAFTWNYNENKTFTAQWTGNTVPITWYNGDTQLTVSNAAQQCTYGETLTLPSIPTPPEPGLVFDGWTIRQLSCTEITDSTTCNNTEGCVYNTIASGCKKYISNCNLLSQEECSNDYASGSGLNISRPQVCGWDGRICCDGGPNCR